MSMLRIYDDRRYCECFRIDGIKSILSGTSGFQQVIKFPDTENHSRFYIFSQNVTAIL